MHRWAPCLALRTNGKGRAKRECLFGSLVLTCRKCVRIYTSLWSLKPMELFVRQAPETLRNMGTGKGMINNIFELFQEVILFTFQEPQDIPESTFPLFLFLLDVFFGSVLKVSPLGSLAEPLLDWNCVGVTSWGLTCTSSSEGTLHFLSYFFIKEFRGKNGPYCLKIVKLNQWICPRESRAKRGNRIKFSKEGKKGNKRKLEEIPKQERPALPPGCSQVGFILCGVLAARRAES